MSVDSADVLIDGMTAKNNIKSKVKNKVKTRSRQSQDKVKSNAKLVLTHTLKLRRKGRPRGGFLSQCFSSLRLAWSAYTIEY